MPPTVVTEKHFREYGRAAERAIERSLGRSAAVGVAAARAKETRVKTGALRSSISATPVRWTRRGADLSIVASDFKALWHELGTLKRRRRKLKASTVRRQQTASGQARLASARGGLKPLYFLQAGKRAAAPVLLASLGREMPK